MSGTEDQGATLGLQGGFKIPGKKKPEGPVPDKRKVNRPSPRPTASRAGRDKKEPGESAELKRVTPGNASWKIPVEEEVEAIQLPTAEELETIRKAAYEEGFASGKEQGQLIGFKHGVKEGQKEIDATLARMKQIMQVLFEPIHQQDEALESVLIDSVISICHLILKRELKIDSSQVLIILKEALSTLKAGYKNMKIHLHPRDAELIKEKLSELPDYNDQWRIVEHTTLSPGGCIVETDSSLLNASLDQRVKQVVQQIYDQEVLQLPGHAGEILDKEERFISSSFSDLAEEIAQERRTLPNSDFMPTEDESLDLGTLAADSIGGDEHLTDGDSEAFGTSERDASGGDDDSA